LDRVTIRAVDGAVHRNAPVLFLIDIAYQSRARQPRSWCIHSFATESHWRYYISWYVHCYWIM